MSREGVDVRGEVLDLDGTGVDANEDSDVEVDAEGDKGLDVAPVPPSRRCDSVQYESESLPMRVSHLNGIGEGDGRTTSWQYSPETHTPP